MTLGNTSGTGSSGALSEAHSGRSDSTSDCTASRCSWRSFAEPSKVSPRSHSAVGPGQIVPANTRDHTAPSRRRINSSGVAPTSPSTEYDQQPG